MTEPLPSGVPAAGALADLLDRVLDLGRDAAALREAAADLTPAAAALLRLVRTGDPTAERALRFSAVGARLLHIRTTRPAVASRLTTDSATDIVVAESAHAVLVLVRDSPRRPGEDRALTRARWVARRVHELDRHAAVVISAKARDAQQLPSVARDAADAAEASAPGALINVEEVWHEVVLRRAGQVLAGQDAPPLQRLLDYDRDHGCDLLSSLSCWLERGGDISRASEALGVHENTLRYRIRRAAEVAGLDLADPRQRLAIALLLTP